MEICIYRILSDRDRSIIILVVDTSKKVYKFYKSYIVPQGRNAIEAVRRGDVETYRTMLDAQGYEDITDRTDRAQGVR